jgi:uncharacterized lipoprotein YddW (UPF0748 family)
MKTAAAAVLTLLFSTFAIATDLPPIKREFRAVWIATVANIDFPSRRDLTVEEQKAEIIADLEFVKKLRMNVVIFQVRPMCDAIYRSKLEPWSEFLTGQMGKPQDFDPLSFVIAEAHKRGILVHAWFNPYRAYHPAAKTISPDHISKRRPDLVRQYGKYLWLDPTDEEVKKHSGEVVLDVVRRYDIDGVHFDDYFYPYPENDAAGKRIEFPDDANWKKYQNTATRGSLMTRDDWRRSHVNDFISSVGRAVKRIKPHVLYGISPFGIWQPMPEKGITGFNQFAELYADARKWLQDGTVDYLAPQLYWETARKAQSFPVLLDWWREQNTAGRYIWPGIATYRIGSTPTFTADEINHQLELTRRDRMSPGAIHFSLKPLKKDLGSIQGKLTAGPYKQTAVIPSFSWIKATAPRAPKITITNDGQLVRIQWNSDPKRTFWNVIDVKDQTGWSTSVVPAAERSMSLSANRRIEKVVIRSVDRLGNVSKAASRSFRVSGTSLSSRLKLTDRGGCPLNSQDLPPEITLKPVRDLNADLMS